MNTLEEKTSEKTEKPTESTEEPPKKISDKILIYSGLAIVAIVIILVDHLRQVKELLTLDLGFVIQEVVVANLALGFL